jgi:MFS transporter, MHS family, alpha-ketoglutarate permease
MRPITQLLGPADLPRPALFPTTGREKQEKTGEAVAQETGALTDVVPPPLVAPISPWRRLYNIIGGSAGNFVEWFDWFVYGAFVIYFSGAFFPAEDPIVQQMNSWFVFAGGFLARPLGAFLMGKYADIKGRRAALSLSVLMMCSGSLLIAITPTYEWFEANLGFGFIAALSLLVARLLQGLSVGGEYGASATYVCEMAGRDRRGFWSGFLYVTLIGGQLAAVGVLRLLLEVMGEEELFEWAWRIPFVIGAIFAVVVFWIRRGIHETKSFENATGLTPQERGKSMMLFTRYPKETFWIIVLTAGGGLGFYTYTSYMTSFLQNTSGFDGSTAADIMLVVLFLFMCAQPLFGYASDLLGRKPLMLLSFGGGALLAVPIMTAIASADGFAMAVVLCLIPLLMLSGYTSLSAIVKAELFPAQVRALGVAVPYSIAQAVFGGNAGSAASAFKAAGNEAGYYWVLAGILACGFVVALMMPDTRKSSLISED